jgi:hypothetical protein
MFLFPALIGMLVLIGFTLSEVSALRSRLSVMYVSPGSQLSAKVPALKIDAESFSINGSAVTSAELPKELSTMAAAGTELIVQVAPDAPGYRVTAGLNAASRAGFTNVALRVEDAQSSAASEVSPPKAL